MHGDECGEYDADIRMAMLKPLVRVSSRTLTKGYKRGVSANKLQKL